jgi:hypothetical protein
MGDVSRLPDGPALVRPDWSIQSGGACFRLAEPGVEMPGYLSRRSGLRRVLLCLAQFGDRRGQAHKAHGQGNCCGHGAFGVAAGHRQEPGGGA